MTVHRHYSAQEVNKATHKGRRRGKIILSHWRKMEASKKTVKRRIARKR